MSALGLSAQAVQDGIIKEYNEKNAKTPLSGVELNVRSAGSTVSDTNGEFSLRFLTLKPGEKVNVRRIEKLGYELFNKEAIEQWNINPATPFVIVMCRADRFKKIRDNYERVSSESYERQLKKEQAQLARLKEEGRLKEDEYNRQLAELNENYEKQLDKLENYVDRFSRIDLSELSATESEIIALVQDGRIDEAIERYDRQGYVDKYTREVSQLKDVSAAIDRLEDVKFAKEQSRDSLLAAINRQVETLRLAGGRENFNKIGVILHDVAYADTTDVAQMREYVDFCQEQKRFSDAIIAMKIIMVIRDRQGIDDLSHAKRVVVRRNIGNIYAEMNDFENAEKYYKESINLCNDSIWTNSYIPQTLLETSEYELGRLYSSSRNFEKAIALLMPALQRAEQDLVDDASSNNYVKYSKMCNELGVYYVQIQQFGKARDFALKAYDTLCLIEEKFNAQNIDMKADYAANLGAVYYYVGDLENSLKYMLAALDGRMNLYEKNPEKYLSSLAQSYGNVGNLYSALYDYDKASSYYEKSYECFKTLFEMDELAYLYPFAMSEYNLSTSYMEIKNYTQALKFISKTKDSTELLYKTSPKAYAKFYIETIHTNGLCYYNLGRKYDAIQCYMDAKSVLEPLYAESQNIYSSTYLNILSSLASAYASIENYENAEAYFLKGIEVGNDIAKHNQNSYMFERH